MTQSPLRPLRPQGPARHARSFLPLLTSLTLAAGLGCAQKVAPDRYCQEAATAIAGRTEACTGDLELADARYAAFYEAYTCVDVPVESMGEDTASLIAPQDRLHCAFAIRNLPCALVEAYGDDIEQYMTASPICGTLVQPKGGAR